MYLSKLNVSGYKMFRDEFPISLNKGLTILVGENGSGKTAIIDAIRLLLNEDEYGRLGTTSSDFHRPMGEPAKNRGVDSIKICGTFSELSSKEQMAYLPWLDATENTTAYLNLQIDNKENTRGRYKRLVWGGESTATIFEWELLDAIACIYLPPLRDAEAKLEAYRGSRLSRLFRKFKPGPDDDPHQLELDAKAFNDQLSKNSDIQKVNEDIRQYLKESLGPVLGQDALIQFSETNFDRIVERLRLLFYPQINDSKAEMFREIAENSLGYNNILYLATVLAELEHVDEAKTFHKILLIEEPEAHLHPQLQVKLLQYIQKVIKTKDIQVIISTHSATITSAAALNSLNILTFTKDGEIPKSTLIKHCELDNPQTFFLERWLDITKSILFFAKGLILVEGIAEALVIKELAKRCIKANTIGQENPPESLEDFGVSIINLNGIYFRKFFSFFQGYRIEETTEKKVDFVPLRCAGITDCDPRPVDVTKPTMSNPCDCGNLESKLFAEELEQRSENCRVFYNLKTFEYDLGMAGNNLKTLNELLLSRYSVNATGAQIAQTNSSRDWASDNDENKSTECKRILDLIKETKGEFAQALAYKLSEEPTLDFTIPKYIEDAIFWATGMDRNEKSEDG